MRWGKELIILLHMSMAQDKWPLYQVFPKYRGACIPKTGGARFPLRAHLFRCAYVPPQVYIFVVKLSSSRTMSSAFFHRYSMLKWESGGLAIEKFSWTKLTTTLESTHSNDRRDGKSSVWRTLLAPLPLGRVQGAATVPALGRATLPKYESIRDATFIAISLIKIRHFNKKSDTMQLGPVHVTLWRYILWVYDSEFQSLYYSEGDYFMWDSHSAYESGLSTEFSSQPRGLLTQLNVSTSCRSGV